MALTGLHVTCGHVGGFSRNRTIEPLLNRPQWSETLPSATTTGQSAPKVDDTYGDPCFELRCSVAAWVAIGPAPSAASVVSTGPSNTRIYLPPDETRHIFANAGDKVAWQAA